MHRTGTVPIAMCLWPGLARLWYLGHWSALATAIGFAFLLNSSLVFSFVWPELVHPHVCLLAWCSAGLLWSFSGWRQWRERDKLLAVTEQPETNNDPLLYEAQCEYLAGNSEETVNLLERILFNDPRDVEARLLLATTFRRQQRFEEAEEQLTAVQKYDGAVKWSDEIENEIELLELAENEMADNEVNPDLNEDSPASAIPETRDLETIVGSVDSEEVSASIQSAPQAPHNAVLDSAAQASDDGETAESTGEMSISERFALQLSSIWVSKETGRTGEGKNDRSDAA